MSDRIDKFLTGSEFERWTQFRLTGDASSRNYTRLIGPLGQSAVMMDTPPDQAESLTAFLRIGAHLAQIGLSPPQTLLADTGSGLLVIEDLGLHHFAEWLMGHPTDETLLYTAATDVLARVQRHPPPDGLTALTPAHAARMISPLTEWYAPNAPLELLVTALEQALLHHAPVADRLSLRDFHAENLIWRAAKTGAGQVGLLDFQDAVLAPPEYDLASLLRDARRDVSQQLCDTMILRFADLSGHDPVKTRAAFVCLSVQRNLRILGIFAGLARRDGKLRYLDLMPRVWGHIQRDLVHPALSELAPLIAAHIQAPA